jgi:hypothetical protein
MDKVQKHNSFKCQLRAPAPLPPDAHCIGGWVDPRAVLDAVVKRKMVIITFLQGLGQRPDPVQKFNY